jgi:ATP-dependent DNA helicase RecG
MTNYTDLELDQPSDLQGVPWASLADLNRRYFEEVYLPAAVAPDVLEANDRTYEQRLAATKMILQRYGAGIPTAMRALEKSGNPPPEFSVQPTFVHVTVRPVQ